MDINAEQKRIALTNPILPVWKCNIRTEQRSSKGKMFTDCRFTEKLPPVSPST